MSRVTELTQQPLVRAALADYRARLDEIVALSLIHISEPTRPY